MELLTLSQLTNRERDATLLGTIGGATYHEVSYVLKTDASGAHQIVGRASDWPLIQLRAENAEQAALLIGLTQQAEQADALTLAAQSRVSDLEQQLAALRAELDQAALIPPALAAAATGLVEPVVVEPQLLQCPDCSKQFGSSQALGSHRHRAHGYRAENTEPAQPADTSAWLCATCGKPGTPSVNEPHRCKRCVRQVVLMQPPAPPVVLARESGSWRCANKGCSGAFTQSLKNSAFCTECAKTQPIGSSNGHAREVGANV